MAHSDGRSVARVAGECVQRHGHDAPRILRERAEMTEAQGDHLGGRAWRDIADAAADQTERRANRVARYRERAAKMRAMADDEGDAGVRRSLLELAEQYEELANSFGI